MTREVHSPLKQSTLNFVGNVEAGKSLAETWM